MADLSRPEEARLRALKADREAEEQIHVAGFYRELASILKEGKSLEDVLTQAQLVELLRKHGLTLVGDKPALLADTGDQSKA